MRAISWMGTRFLASGLVAALPLAGAGCAMGDDAAPAPGRARSAESTERAALSQGAPRGGAASVAAGERAGDHAPADAPARSVASALLDLVPFVDPLIGTGPSDAPNAIGGGQGGSVFPGAVVPFGMVQWSPDTPHGEPSGYGYGDTDITGFSLTHYSGAGCRNNGDLPFLPTLGAGATRFPFHHENEHATAGRYDVTSDEGIRFELTATARTGMGRLTYPSSGDPTLVIDGTRTQSIPSTTGQMHAVGSDGLAGSTVGGDFCGTKNAYTLFYVVQFDRPWKAATVEGGKATVSFSPGGEAVKMKVGISYVSEENARLNLDADTPGWDFDAVATAARKAWNDRLNAIQVQGGTDENRTKLYTALYHALLAPNVYSDVDGAYRGFDGAVRTLEPGRVQYANYSGWDIYRCEIQLLSLLFPDVAADIVQSLVRDAEQCGTFPKWSQNNAETGVMVGDPGSVIVASAYAFGVRSFDTQSALAIMKRVGSVPGTQCGGHTTLAGLSDYLSRGYIATGEWGGASTTLEYASRDFAVAQFAKSMGDDGMYRTLMGRSTYWRNELHPSGLIETRTADGGWKLPLDGPSEGQNREYVEGNAEQYTWMVPFDPRTLFDAVGGDARVVPRLDAFFTKLNAGVMDPNFYMGNEPNFATPWLYDWSGAPWRTQDVVRRIMDETFAVAPGGLPGNDDLGAMSAWFVWAALGLYPEVPGVSGLVVSSPLFGEAVVHTGAGHDVKITAAGAPGRYVQSATLNGAPSTRLWLPLETLAGGATLAYVLGDRPSTWGSAPSDAPPSFGPGRFTTLAAAFNSQGIVQDGVAAGADFDGFGFAYSAEALAAAGALGPTVVHGGVSFPWPATAGALDNVIADGQTLVVPAGRAGGRLSFLGAASSGPSTGTGTLRYTDGSTAPFTVTLSDWTLNGGTASLADGNEVAVHSAYRTRGADADRSATFVFVASIPLDPARVLESVTLPAIVSAGRMHVFSVAVAP